MSPAGKGSCSDSVFMYAPMSGNNCGFRALVRRLLAIPDWVSDVFLLRQEQHPGRPIQFQLDLAA